MRKELMQQSTKTVVNGWCLYTRHEFVKVCSTQIPVWCYPRVLPTSSTTHWRCAVVKFNTLHYNILVTKLKGEAFHLVSSVRDGSGLELWRLLVKRYAPRTHLQHESRKPKRICSNWMRSTASTRHAAEPLPEDVKTVIMVEHCTPELRVHLEFNAKDIGSRERREAVMAQRRRDVGDSKRLVERHVRLRLGE